MTKQAKLKNFLIAAALTAGTAGQAAAGNPPEDRCEIGIDKNGLLIAVGFVNNHPRFLGTDFVEPGPVGILRDTFGAYSVPDEAANMRGAVYANPKRSANPQLHGGRVLYETNGINYAENSAWIELSSRSGESKLSCSFRDPETKETTILPVTTPWPKKAPSGKPAPAPRDLWPTLKLN